MDLGDVDEWDLLCVANAVAAHPAGSQLLRQTVLGVADMTGASFNYAHEVVALLLCEGVATVLEMNYDNCIERAAQPEIPMVVRTPTELLHGSSSALMKVHGCATLPQTMLVTSADLEGVGFWADAIVRANLSQNHFVFIGIGSVADYVQASLETVVGAVGNEHLYLVDPALADWEVAEPPLDWKVLLGDLPLEQRVASPAEEFCDALLRAYVLTVCQSLAETVDGFPPEHPQKQGVQQLLSAIHAVDGVKALRWLRGISWGYAPGTSVASSAVTLEVLVALSGLMGAVWGAPALGSEVMGFSPLTNSAHDERFDVMPLLSGHGARGPAVVKEAERRVAMARRSGDLSTDAPVLVVAGGHLGSLGSAELQAGRMSNLDDVLADARRTMDGLAFDLIGSSEPSHLIDGPAAGHILYVRAGSIGEVS
ncbi:hypothetical protein D4739_15315 [Nocardioides cavernaquae]|uniref:Uncharacterized protein n=2 Tax=Nocardioides cavernaquae TaxID=2321396 RepID=A0A3A5HHU3_9ACTN|nr:hypothetical protein D4739_15315 [Nocardioides cavernaquae]